MKLLRIIPIQFILIALLFLTNCVLAQDSANVRRVGNYVATSIANDVLFEGQTAYLCASGQGLVILNMTGTTPVVVGSYDTPSTASKVAIQSNLAFIADLYSGLQVVNIANPASPTHVATWCENNAISDVKVVGNRIYAAGGGFHIFNIPTDTVLTRVGYYTPSGGVYNSVTINGTVAYLTADGAGIIILDLSASMPTLIGTFDTPGYAKAAVLDPVLHRLYVADSYTVRILDVTNPTTPTELGSIDTPGEAIDVEYSGTHVYVAESDDGMEVYDVASTANPVLVGYFRNSGSTNGLSAPSNGIILAATGVNLQVLNIEQALGVVDRVSESVPTKFVLKSNYPNPFNATTEIRYSIAKSGNVDLCVFDVNGREVVKLVNFNQDPGEYRFQFSGKDLATGTYFVRLTAGNSSQLQKIVLLK